MTRTQFGTGLPFISILAVSVGLAAAACGSGDSDSGFGTGPVTCSDSQTYSPSEGQCVDFDSSQCGDGTFLNVDTGMCGTTCPTGTMPDATRKVCAADPPQNQPIECGPGSALNAATGMCVAVDTSKCGDGTFLNPETDTCGTTCPAGYTADAAQKLCVADQNTGGGGAGSGGAGSGGVNTGGSVNIDDLPPADVKVDRTPKAACAETAVTGVTYTVDAAPAVWRDGASAAYSMAHDDQCGAALSGIDEYAVPLYQKWGLVGGPGPFVNACDENAAWDKVRTAASAGLEILNHSYTHVIDEGAVRVSNAQLEVYDAKAKFDEELAKITENATADGRPIQKDTTFFIFPFDEFQDPGIVDELAKAGHLGARAGFRDPFNGCPASLCGDQARPPVNNNTGQQEICTAAGCGEPSGVPVFDDLHITFDVWPRTYSKYALYTPADILTAYVYDAIDNNGWAFREFHSVTGKDVTDLNQLPTDEGFGPIPAKLFDEHLKFLAGMWKRNEVWTCNPTECIRYRRTRQAFTASISGSTISYSGTIEPQYATPVSVMVTTSQDVGSLVATQNGTPVSTRKVGASKFSVTADPSQGPVEITSACSDADPNEVQSDFAVAPRPQPASSVCDIVTVTGDGSDGTMDDLTRNTEAGEGIFTLPNPGQADGRDGAWSGYGAQSYGIEEEDGNPYLRFTPSGSGFSGVTLAFLGGNGAGSCYDASAYCSVKFRARTTSTVPIDPGGVLPVGADATTNQPDGNVFVALITAGTATPSFGGNRTDFLEDTGHYGFWTKIAADWTPVELPLDGSKMIAPWWCRREATPAWSNSCPQFPWSKAELQSIDFSFGESPGNVTLDIDDVELVPCGG